MTVITKCHLYSEDSKKGDRPCLPLPGALAFFLGSAGHLCHMPQGLASLAFLC